jgi:hypothetical protein
MALRALLVFLGVALAGSGTAQAQIDSERVVPSKRVTTFVHIRTAPDADSTEKGRLPTIV